MSEVSETEERESESRQLQNALITIGVAILLITLGLLAIAVVLAGNAQTTAPGVQVIRDLLIIVVTLEVIVVGAAFIVFLIQVARLVNLISNEVEPLIEATSDTVNTVRGTAVFLSKNLVEPVVSMNSTLRGLAKVAGDVDALRKAAGVAVQVANAVSPTSATSTPSPVSSSGAVTEEVGGASDVAVKQEPAKKRRSSKKIPKED
jgi:hypothetical protein